ncbi:MAG: DUF1330 domain-containing protein [Pseudomonadota bacterium]
MSNLIDPTREQFGAMMKMADDGPVNMLNLIRLNETANYDDGRKMTGAEAYRAYGEESRPIFERVGGRIIWSGEPRLMLIGPEDERWDIAFIAEYPSAAAFGEMVKDNAYQKIVHHRQAAVKESRLIRMAPRDSGTGFGQ